MFLVSGYYDKAVMNIVEQVTFCDSGASFGFMPRSSIAGSSERTISSFLRNYRLISRVVVQVCNPSSNGGVFPFSTSLPACVSA